MRFPPVAASRCASCTLRCLPLRFHGYDCMISLRLSCHRRHAVVVTAGAEDMAVLGGHIFDLARIFANGASSPPRGLAFSLCFTTLSFVPSLPFPVCLHCLFPCAFTALSVVSPLPPGPQIHIHQPESGTSVDVRGGVLALCVSGGLSVLRVPCTRRCVLTFVCVGWPQGDAEWVEARVLHGGRCALLPPRRGDWGH